MTAMGLSPSASMRATSTSSWARPKQLLPCRFACTSTAKRRARPTEGTSMRKATASWRSSGCTSWVAGRDRSRTGRSRSPFSRPARRSTASRSARRAAMSRHVDATERAARGKAERAKVPRSAHAEWAPQADRSDPVALLEEQGRTRDPELVPIRYGRMLQSPFAFFRGAAYLMASDLAAVPQTDLQVQLCGDAHLSNFGVFAAPDRRLVFSVNDFDETLPGPFEWDVKRLVASFAVAGRDRGFDAKKRKVINRAVVRAYREAMREFAGMRNLDIWFARLDLDDIARRMRSFADAKQIRRFDRNVAKAHSKDSLRAFGKLTTMVDGEPRIVADHPVLTPVEDLMTPKDRERVHAMAEEIIGAYRDTLPDDRRRLMEEYRYVHAARKVVGVGSVGTRAWIMLLLGRDGDDPLFLQFKEAQPSVLEPALGAS